MTFRDAINSPQTFLFCGLGVLLVTLIILYYLVFSIKHAKALGVTNQELMTVVKTTISVSFGPALSILVPLFALISVLGSAWSWLRLSVIGSAAMELIVANMAILADGYTELLPDVLPAEAFGLLTLSISIGVCAGTVLNLFCNKFYSQSFQKLRQKNSSITKQITDVLFSGLIIGVIGPGIFKLGTDVPFYIDFKYTLVFLTSLCSVGVLGILAKKYNLKALINYGFSISLLIGMGSAIVYFNIIP
ncbi:hypothetical protein AN396_01610 [Candidatus Epulonipiscium fishelsonii]|uniref:Uncharacterized protein n=1 Tax=Candidatus Epulonipiscium fishelsonii TaxID=77094 RepID=A0ACC8XH88_9FIRM|nr:hypothetical protein AN396_01610 [Epulopiscium sp. SCG-B11WGA-EpuloA1]